MFSRQTAARFEKGRDSTIDPGLHSTPSTVENRVLAAETRTTGDNDLKHDDNINDLTGPLTVIARKRSGMEKENCAPLIQRKKRISLSQSYKLHEIVVGINQEDLPTSQSPNEHKGTMNEERNNRIKYKDNEHKVAASDVKSLNETIESLEERLAKSERDRKLGDKRLLQQQARTKELEQSLQELIVVLEDSLHREEKKRRELEKRTESDILEKENGATEFEIEQRHVVELQRRVTEFEFMSELKHVETRKQTNELRRAGQRQMDLEMRVARAESDFATECVKTAALKQNVVNMESQIKNLTQQLENEQERSEQLQQHMAINAESKQTNNTRDQYGASQSFQESVVRAEAEAEAASEEFQRWKEWADGEPLRRRSSLCLLLPWLDAKVVESNQDPYLHNGIAKVYIETEKSEAQDTAQSKNKDDYHDIWDTSDEDATSDKAFA